MTAPRVLVYVQHLVGVGHFHRAATLAAAFAERGAAVTLVSGGIPVARPLPPSVRYVQLPPARAADLDYSGLVEADGTPVTEDWRNQRRHKLLTTFDETEPDILITELFPFGRRKFRFELVPLLDRASRARPAPLTLCSVRDIIERSSDPQRVSEQIALFENRYDAALVHGDRSFIPLESSLPEAAALSPKLIYTGYVTPPPAPDAAGEDTGGDEILVSAGGGASGAPLFEAAIDAFDLSGGLGRTWRLLIGNNLPEADFAALAARARPGLIVERARPGFPNLLKRAALSVSQSGYNTVVETLLAHTRMVLVPHVTGKEREQITRAQALEAKGRATVLLPGNLSGQTLAEIVKDSLAGPPPQPLDIGMNGAANAAAAALHLWTARTASPSSSPPDSPPDSPVTR